MPDNVRKIVKTKTAIRSGKSLLNNLKLENPNLNIARVTRWENNYLDILLNTPSDSPVINTEDNTFALLPYTLIPSKCAYCQKWGHHIQKCKSTRATPTCFRCGTGHPRVTKDSPCTRAIKCANCQGAHCTHNKRCPEYTKAVKHLAGRSNQGTSQKVSQTNKPTLNLKSNTPKSGLLYSQVASTQKTQTVATPVKVIKTNSLPHTTNATYSLRDNLMKLMT